MRRPCPVVADSGRRLMVKAGIMPRSCLPRIDNQSEKEGIMKKNRQFWGAPASLPASAWEPACSVCRVRGRGLDPLVGAGADRHHGDDDPLRLDVAGILPAPRYAGLLQYRDSRAAGEKLNLLNNLSVYFVGGILLYAYITSSGAILQGYWGSTASSHPCCSWRSSLRWCGTRPAPLTASLWC